MKSQPRRSQKVVMPLDLLKPTERPGPPGALNTGQVSVQNNHKHQGKTMALGTIDFTVVTDFTPVPSGRYEGQTGGWKAVPTKAGDSINIEASFDYEDNDGKQRKFTQRWNLKPQALWRIKRDLVSMGADPEDLEGEAVDLESVLNGLFGSNPTPVWLTFGVTEFRNSETGELRSSNELEKVEARG